MRTRIKEQAADSLQTRAVSNITSQLQSHRHASVRLLASRLRLADSGVPISAWTAWRIWLFG
jgi:hypothetical protein